MGAAWLFLFPVAGLLLSTICYVAASADRHLVSVYRAQLTQAVGLVLDGVPEAERTTVDGRWAHAGMSRAKGHETLGEVDAQQTFQDGGIT